jgi:FeS assembly SUF system regulator
LVLYMLRVTKLADYGIVMLIFFANNPESTYNAKDISNAVRLPLPVASKVLKLLSKSGLLLSRRGTKGGYGLARPPEEITIASIIHALEGPIALTACSAGNRDCSLVTECPARTNWNMINQAIHSALDKLTLAQMKQPLQHSRISLRVPIQPSADGMGGLETE